MTQQTEIITKQEARNGGLKHYFTGKLCSKGHLAKRHMTGTCVECAKIALAAWTARNPEKTRARLARYYAAHPERVKAASVRSWRKRAGIPAAERPKPAHCELCAVAADGVRMHLDHDHASGKFRGWLCSRCNMAIGVLGDTVAGLEKALAYLRRNGSS
jgi:hypothetical protein